MLQPRPIASYSMKHVGVPHLLKKPGGILKYDYTIYSFHVTLPTKSSPVLNRIIIFFIILLYDLMLHTLINKILHVNIMEWHPTWLFWVYREYDSSYVGMGVRRKYPILTQ